MRCLLFVVVAMFLVAGSQGLTACSGGGGEEAKPASTKAVSSADLSWDDVPVFPRARALKSDTKMFDETVKRSHTAKGEMRIWESGASSDEVIAFFKAELPKNGWEKIMNMQMGPNSYIMTWHKKVKGEDKGITVNVADGQEEGKVRYSITMGQGER